MDDQGFPKFPTVCIGGSAGALDPLLKIAGAFPEDFPAAVFITTHVPPASVSALPHILNRAGALFATHAIDGAPIAPGRIIVAPPNHHLVLQTEVMRVLDGPAENNHRPSIDVLFRSASKSFGSGVCGVLLSGTLDDGVAGLISIHEAGGATFVQDPDDAQYDGMPINAIKTGVVDGVFSPERLVDAIVQWASRPLSIAPSQVTPRDERDAGVPSVYTCPDCGGTLWELDEEGVLRFKCRTADAYGDRSTLSTHEQHLESALRASIRALEERRELLARLMARSRRSGDATTTSRRFERRLAEAEVDIQCVRSALASLLGARV